MNFDKLIRDRYSVRKYEDKKIEENKITEIIEAARVAPSAGDEQPTVIYVLNEEQIETVKGFTKYHFNAKNMFFIGYDKNLSWKRSYDGYDYGIEDTAIAITHMMLKITDLGLGSCWVGDVKPELREALKVDENIVLIALLPFGYIPKGDKPSLWHEDRRPIEEIRREL